MNLMRYGVAIGLLASLGACSNMSNMFGGGGGSSERPRMAATQPAVSPDTVKQVQSKLRDSGYYKNGPVDGVWGAGTESAVRSFQHDHNMNASGQLDVATLQALNVTPSSSTSPNAQSQNNPPPQSDNANNPPPPPPPSR